jgi:hypothetical protein
MKWLMSAFSTKLTWAAESCCRALAGLSAPVAACHPERLHSL